MSFNFIRECVENIRTFLKIPFFVVIMLRDSKISGFFKQKIALLRDVERIGKFNGSNVNLDVFKLVARIRECFKTRQSSMEFMVKDADGRPNLSSSSTKIYSSRLPRKPIPTVRLITN